MINLPISCFQMIIIQNTPLLMKAIGRKIYNGTKPRGQYPKTTQKEFRDSEVKAAVSLKRC